MIVVAGVSCWDLLGHGGIVLWDFYVWVLIEIELV